MSHLPLVEVTHEPVNFSPAVVSHLVQEGDSQVTAVGKVAKNGNVAAIAKGANLDIINLSSNERLAAWSFCSSTQEPETEITCLVPFSSDPTSKNISHVLVGLDTGLHGLVAVFDITESKVVRAVALPQRVGSLALVSGCGGPSTPPYLHPALLYFHGIVAVGMMEGRTLLLDLNMDETIESTDSSPAGVTFISCESRDVARLRRNAIDAGTHLGLEVAVFSQGETFTWDSVVFPSDCVQVTCLHFCPQLASLAVGYNCGVWLLLTLTTPLAPVYASPYTKGLASVVGLSWQEPLDDPRHHTYYWVLRGAGDSLASASLYSLTFRRRQWDLVEGPCYDSLESVTLRFHHELGGDPAQGGADVSRVVCVDTLELALSTGGTHDRSGGSEVEQVKDMSLVVMVWECDKATTYMGVFDINCWYQAQMPGSVTGGGGLCPYLSVCELGESAVVDLKIDTDSIAKFGPSSSVEQHFYPSSLKFNLLVVSGEGCILATHLGLQRKVLAELSRPSSLVQPSELYQFCLLSGLATGLQLEPSLLAQRKTLLTVALEQSMVGVVVAAVRDWSDGRYSKAGCSLKFLLDWAWNRVVTIKEMIDTQTVPLFDYSLTEVDAAARGTLVSLAGQLAQLVTVLSSLASMGGIMTEIGQEELECRLNVTGLVLLYTQAISWFVNVGLLPEQMEGPGNPFPVSQLESQYSQKRKQLAGLQGPFGRPGLMVDILCEDIGDNLICSFQKAGGTGSYPPPSLHSLIATFLSESPAPAKLRLVQYFFLDLAHLLPPDQFSELVDSLIKFPSAFSLPPSVIKLTQAFWLLDHEDWEEAVSMMLDPLLQEDDLTPSHHRAILVALLAQAQPTLALKYTRIRRPPCMLPEDVSLHISVLLANGAIQEAFTFQRSRRGCANSSNILAQFYSKAEELGKLDAVLQLSLTTQEEKEFVSFLQSSSRVDSQEVLLMYYLQRSRFTEAMQLNLSLKTLGRGGSSAREAIMERYNHILPGLASTLGSRRVTLTSAHGMGTRPVPLSVTLQDRNIRLNSHASAIEARLSTPVSMRTDNQFTPFRARGRRGEGIVRPTDITQNAKRKADETTICYPNETFQDYSILSSTKINGTNLVSPPRKRTRLSDVTSLNMSVKSMRRMSRYMTAEAITILSTPTITRVKKAATSARLEGTGAPTSILKVKQLIRDVSPAVEGDKILDVSLSLDNTPTIGSRDITPTKSLRFKEPRKFPSDLAAEIPKASADDSQVSNDTNDSFHSVTSMNMDVDSPLTFKGTVKSQLASKNFGGRPSIGTLSGLPTNSTLVQGESLGSSALPVLEEKTLEKEETSRVLSGITITSVSPDVQAELREVLKKAESKLKDEEKKRYLVAELDKTEIKETPEPEKEVTQLLGEKDLVIQLEGEESQDSDASMHGKSWQRSIEGDAENESSNGEDYESEDDNYYENRVFERKECNIIMENSDNSKESSATKDEDVKVDDVEGTQLFIADENSENSAAQGVSWQRTLVSEESKVVIEESSQDSDDQGVSWERKLDVEKQEQNLHIGDDRTKDEVDVSVPSEPQENYLEEPSNVEESEESEDSDAEPVKLDISWEQQQRPSSEEGSEFIKQIVADETIHTSVEVIEDDEESIIIEDVGESSVFVEDLESNDRLENVIEEKRKISTIDLDDSADEKAPTHLSFSSDSDNSVDVDEVIEIESDEEQAEETVDSKPDEQTGKVIFSSLFSQSSNETDEELEVSNVDEVKANISVSSEPKSDVDLVIVEDESKSSEISNKSSEAVTTGAVLFSTVGDQEKSVSAESVSAEDTNDGEGESKMEEELVKADIVQDTASIEQEDNFMDVSDKSEHEEYEDPSFYEEPQLFDLEADFFSPGAKVKQATTAKEVYTSYSYDVCTTEVDKERKPTAKAQEERIETSLNTEVDNPMKLVEKIIAEAKAFSEPAPSQPEPADGTPTEEESLPPADDDEMRELLDHVSTTATRASSIAGSILGEARAQSVSDSFCSEVTSAHGQYTSTTELETIDDEHEYEEEEDDTSANLDLSWTNVPLQGTLSVSQLVDEEIKSETLNIFSTSAAPVSPFLFGKPEVNQESVGSHSTDPTFEFQKPDVGSRHIDTDDIDDFNDSQFEFGKPLDISMDVDESEDEKVGEDRNDESKTDFSDNLNGVQVDIGEKDIFSTEKVASDDDDVIDKEKSEKDVNSSDDQLVDEEKSEKDANSSDDELVDEEKSEKDVNPSDDELVDEEKSDKDVNSSDNELVDEEESEKDGSSDDESEDDDNITGGLEFSWTKIPTTNTASISQLIDEEIEQEAVSVSTLSTDPTFKFEKPDVGSHPIDTDDIEDLNDSQFEFGKPLDESMDMEETEHKVDFNVQGITKLEKPIDTMVTPTKATKTLTPVRRSTRKTSQSQEDKSVKPVPVPLELTPAKATNTPKKSLKEVSKKSPGRKAKPPPDKVTKDSIERPRRGMSSRESSADESVSLVKAPSLASTEPMVSDVEDRAEQISSSTKKRGRTRKISSAPLVEKASSNTLSESTVSQMEISVESSSMKARTSSKASTVEMDTDSVKSESNIKLQKTAITTEMDDLAIAATTAPATPIRRSRRISGATPAPAYTPSLLRSRRTSGTTSTPAKKFDELELRNRTVVETLSLVSDFGQKEEVPDDQNKFDTLELRNRIVTETLSLTENFGVNEKEEVTHVTPEKDSSKVAQRTRRRNRSTTPDSSPAKASKPEKLNLDVKSKTTDKSTSSPKESPGTRTRRQSKKEGIEMVVASSSKESPVKRSTRTTKKELSSPLPTTEVETAPATPSKVTVTALPKHLTPLKKVSTPRKEELPLTPTRRSRRLSSGDLGSEPPTPTRRSRRLSGAADLESAPDGGLIAGGTPRKAPSTPRRHTSVRPEDVDAALAIAGGVTPLPTLVEEDEKDVTAEKDEIEAEAPPISKRGRKSVKPPPTPSLNVISEEDVSNLPDDTADESFFFPMKSRPKRKEEDHPADPPPKRRSRRVTITTLGTDVDLFTPVKATPASTSGTSRRESTGQAGSKKKYVPVKRKTSVRIK